MGNKEKSILDILEEVAEAMCNEYCRYPIEIDDENTLYNEYCAKCPLNLITV